MRKPVLTAGAGLALVLAGCSGVTVYPTQFSGSYGGGEYDYAAGGRDFNTVVIGNPFGGDDAAFGRRVAGILNEHNARQETNFTTTPGANARLQYKLVLLFNGGGREIPNTLCGDTQRLRGGPARTAPITLQAGFCNGPVSTSDVYASVANGADAEQFRDLIEQVQIALFPTRVRARVIP